MDCSKKQCVRYLGQGLSDICTEKCPAIIDWKQFLQEAKIEEMHRDEWEVLWRDAHFHVKYDSLLFFPRPLAGASVYRIKKIRVKETPDRFPETEWTIHVQAENMPNHDQEVSRVVWCHLARTGGDYCTLYKYDRLDKSRPEGAIGQPINLKHGIKRWKMRPHAFSIAEVYLYVAPDGRKEDVILVDTIHGYKWEVSMGCSRYSSLEKAEKEIIKFLSPKRK
jgi:hypothetical protein